MTWLAFRLGAGTCSVRGQGQARCGSLSCDTVLTGAPATAIIHHHRSIIGWALRPAEIRRLNKCSSDSGTRHERDPGRRGPGRFSIRRRMHPHDTPTFLPQRPPHDCTSSSGSSRQAGSNGHVASSAVAAGRAMSCTWRGRCALPALCAPAARARVFYTGFPPARARVGETRQDGAFKRLGGARGAAGSRQARRSEPAGSRQALHPSRMLPSRCATTRRQRPGALDPWSRASPLCWRAPVSNHLPHPTTCEK
jgi:hypothetical protein